MQFIRSCLFTVLFYLTLILVFVLAIPILPDLDICSIKSACKNIKLTDRDEKKNRIVKEVIY